MNEARKIITLSIYLTVDEHAKLAQAAKDEKLKISTYARRTLMGRIELESEKLYQIGRHRLYGKDLENILDQHNKPSLEHTLARIANSLEKLEHKFPSKPDPFLSDDRIAKNDVYCKSEADE